MHISVLPIVHSNIIPLLLDPRSTCLEEMVPESSLGMGAHVHLSCRFGLKVQAGAQSHLLNSDLVFTGLFLLGVAVLFSVVIKFHYCFSVCLKNV